jgi:DNA-directed RNA polymerase subunit RPC12/RpoP
MAKDVTSLVDFQNPDDESLPITSCVCGASFEPWHFIISIYEDSPTKCPHCGVELWFRIGVKVFANNLGETTK